MFLKWIIGTDQKSLSAFLAEKNRKDKKLSKIFWQTAVELHGKEKNTPAHCCQCQPSAFSDLYTWIGGEPTSMSAGPTLTRCLKKSSSYGQKLSEIQTEVKDMIHLLATDKSFKAWITAYPSKN